MTDLLQYVVLGLGAGAAYALLAEGVVLVYRGSGIVNFAHGALAMVAAYFCFVTFQENAGWALAPSIIASIALTAVIGLLFQVVVLRPLRGAAPIVRLISTLGLLVILQSAVEIRYGAQFKQVDQFLPDDVYEVGGITIQQDRIILLVLAIVLTIGLWSLLRLTRTGLAITASAQNERAVKTLGWSPDRLAALTWASGAALGAVAGILVAPLTGLTPTTLTLVVTINALAAALLGGFSSIPLTLAGGLLLGIGESLVTRYQGDIQDFLGLSTLTGASRAVPFLVILLVLVVRGRGLPLRSHLAEQLPRLGTGVTHWWALIVVTAATAGIAIAVLDDKWQSSLAATLTAAVFILSVIVLTGFAGQLSLAQYALGGLGALFAARLIASAGWSTELAIVTGVALTIIAGLVFALPAVRTRGVNLAVVTLGLGLVVQEVVFANPNWTGNPIDGGTKIGGTRLFGIDVNAIDHPGRWAVVCLVVFVLAGLLVANLRRSRTGRRLLAVRTNERAAASLGISVLGVKLYAFAVSAGIAALAGILLGFRNPTVTYSAFNPFESINLVAQAVIGGVGYVLGAVFGAPFAAGGLGARLMGDVLSLGEWETFVSGVVLILVLIIHADGIADAVSRLAMVVRERIARRREPAAIELPDIAGGPVQPRTLAVHDLTVRFGTNLVLDGIDLRVEPGDVVGLIGPNGAGKTTFIDAVTGFVDPARGTISLDDDRIDTWHAARRARAGLRRSFQSLELFEDISVADNIHAGADRATGRSWLTDLLWPGRHPLPATAVAAIREFDLVSQLSRLPTELPYGQRRLVGIARAAASGPSVLMLDEPAAGLDEVESHELATLIRRLADQRRMAVLLVEHDVGLVMSICDRVTVLAAGRVIAHGTPEEVRADRFVRAAYLGETEEIEAVES